MGNIESSGNNVLEIRMFGGLSVYWQGIKLIVARNAAPRYLQLAELVWIRGAQGIEREELLQCLYETKALKSSSNSINNLLYQLRKAMVNAGLPQAEYVIRRKKRYYPDPEVLISTDVAHFESLSNQALRMIDENSSALDESTDIPHRTELIRVCEEAAKLYRGELLPELGDKTWAVRERKRLQALYQRLPSDLISSPTDAATAQEINQNIPLKRTSSNKEGTSSSSKKRPGKTVSTNNVSLPSSFSNAEDILSKLLGQANVPVDGSVSVNDALQCDQKEFEIICRQMSALCGQIVYPMHLMIFLMVDYKGQPLQEGKKLPPRSESMRKHISENLRRGDVYTITSPTEVHVLALGYNKQERARLMRRVRKGVRESFPTVRILWSECAITPGPN